MSRRRKPREAEAPLRRLEARACAILQLEIATFADRISRQSTESSYSL